MQAMSRQTMSSMHKRASPDTWTKMKGGSGACGRLFRLDAQLASLRNLVWSPCPGVPSLCTSL